MAAELVQYAEAVGNFLRSMEQFSDFEQLRTIEVQRLVEKLEGKSFSFPEASLVADALKKLPLMSSQKDALLSRLAGAVQANGNPAPVAAARRGMQDFTDFGNMMDDATWSVVQNQALSTVQRFDCIATYLAVKLGLRCSSEPTWAAVTALILLGDNHESMTPAQKLSSYRHMSSRGKAICESQGPVRRTWITKLPSSPDLLPSDYRDVAAQIVACRVNQAQLNTLRNSIPCRVTHKSVRSDAVALSALSSPCQPAGAPGNMMAQMMMQMMMQMFHGTSQRRERDADDELPAGFTMLRPRGSSPQVDASVRSLASAGMSPGAGSHTARTAGPVTLSDPAALTHALARDPAGVLTATAPGGPAAAAPAAPTARDAALVLAAPAAPAAPPTAAPTAALALAAPTAAPLPAAAPTAPAMPADIFATTALLRQKRAQVQKKPATKANKRRRAGASHADPSQADPSDADPNQAGPSDADPSQAGANPNQAGSSSDQNPADPNQAGSSGTPRLVLPFSKEEAKIKAPNGCSKCRYKPGCTPSCWRARGFRSWA